MLCTGILFGPLDDVEMVVLHFLLFFGWYHFVLNFLYFFGLFNAKFWSTENVLDVMLENLFDAKVLTEYVFIVMVVKILFNAELLVEHVFIVMVVEAIFNAKLLAENVFIVMVRLSGLHIVVVHLNTAKKFATAR